MAGSGSVREWSPVSTISRRVRRVPHELQVEDDSDRSHGDAKPNERNAEIPSRVRPGDDVRLFEVLEELIDREAEADERQRGANDAHQRAITLIRVR